MGISVLIATYNRVKSLKLAVESILRQKHLPYQLIIVNDASTDETKEWLTSYNFDPVTVNIIHNDTNLGLAQSLNMGLSFATEDLIARLDDDDIWIDPNKLQKQLETFETYPNLVLLGTGILVDGKEIINPLTDSELRNQILFRCPFQHSTVMFRREVNQQAVVYNNRLPYSEDWDLWLNLGRYGDMMNLPDITTRISLHDNLSDKFYVSQHAMNLNILKQYFFHYPRKNRAYLYHILVVTYFKLDIHKLPIHSFLQSVFNVIFMKRKS